MYQGEDRRNEQWHLDKRVPVAIIVMITLHIAGGAWFASDISTRVGNIESHQEENFATKDWAVGEHGIINANLKHNADTANDIKDSVSRMEDKMDKMYDLLLNHNSINGSNK